MSRRLLPRALLLLGLLSPSGLAPLLAGENPELNRSEPVPATQQIPAIDFFRPSRFRQPSLNPAGTHFTALITNDEESTELLLVNIASKKRQIGSGGTDRGTPLDILRADWLDDTRLLFSVSADKRYAYGLYTCLIDDLLKATPLVRRSVVDIISIPKEAPTQPVLWLRKDAHAEGEDSGAIQIDGTRALGIAKGTSLLAPTIREFPAPPGANTKRYLSDKEGNLSFAITSSQGLLKLWSLEGKAWLQCPVDLEKINIIGPGDKPRELIVAPDNAKGQASRLLRLDTGTGELGEELYSDKDYSLTRARLHHSGRDRRITALTYEKSKPVTVWFDEDGRQLYEGLCQNFKGCQIDIESADKEEQKFIFSVRSDVQPQEYYYFDKQTQKISPLTKSRPWIDPARMAPMRKFSYKARDGLGIDSYVTLPLGTTRGQPVSLIVFPHGGPFVRDSWGWSPAVQFLASRGYAVFQPNYRGSIGYDWSLAAEDPLLFRKMHDDVTDGVRQLIASGVADPSRIAIMGGSFGGYLSICGVVNEPALYRCAITIAGVFDWERVMKEAKSYDTTNDRYRMLLRNLGDPRKNPEIFEAISPLRHIDRIKVPIYVAHGEEDTTAYLKESTTLIAELKKHGVPYEKQIEQGEGHGFRKLENRVELYTAIEAFLAKNMAKPATQKP